MLLMNRILKLVRVQLVLRIFSINVVFMLEEKQIAFFLKNVVIIYSLLLVYKYEIISVLNNG